MNTATDPLLNLLERLNQEGVRYILIGGHAVRLNGFLRATEDIDLLLPLSAENGRRVKKALAFLPGASELDANWFEGDANAPENIRVADELLIDLLFAANGETYDSLEAHVRTLRIDGVDVHTLDIEGLLRTKTTFREKDLIDRQALTKILADVKRGRGS